jgi:hypothetical protein
LETSAPPHHHSASAFASAARTKGQHRGQHQPAPPLEDPARRWKPCAAAQSSCASAGLLNFGNFCFDPVISFLNLYFVHGLLFRTVIGAVIG